MAQLDKGSGHFGLALQGHADAKHRERQLALFKFTQDAPDARARAIFVNAFHRQVALGKARRVEHFREKLLGPGITVEHGVFAAFLVIQHKLHGDAGLARPLRVRRLAAVAAQIARVGRARVVSVIGRVDQGSRGGRFHQIIIARRKKLYTLLLTPEFFYAAAIFKLQEISWA